MLSLKRFPLADELPYWELEEAVIFTRSGRMEVGFELELPPMLFFSDEDLLDFGRRFAHFLRLGIPEGERFRLLVEARQEGEVYLEGLRAMEGSYTHPLGSLFFRSQLDLYERLAKEGILRTWRYYGFVSATPPRGLVRGMFSEQEFAEAMNLAQAIREDVRVRLSSMGIKVSVPDDQRLFETLWRWFNPHLPAPPYEPPGRRAPYGTPDYRGLTAQMARTPVDNAYPTRIRAGDYWISGVAMIASPDITWPGFADVLLAMNGEFYLVLDWYHRETAKEIRRMSSVFRTATAMSKSDTTVDPSVHVKAENFAEAMRRVSGEGQHVFDVSAHLVFLDRDEKALVRKVLEAKGLMAAMGGVRGMEIADFFEAWISLAPGSGLRPYYKAQLLEDNASDFMPTWTPWRGLERPVAAYEGQGGVVVSLDPFSPQFPAKHAIVVGGSGRGKSFFVQGLLNRLALQGVEVVIVDRGLNYQSWVELVGGSTVIVDPIEGTSINPFELKEGELFPSEEKKDLIRAIFRAIVPPPLDEQEAVVEEVIFMAAVEATYLMHRQEDDQGRPYLEPFTLSSVVRKLRTMEAVNGRPMGPSEREIANRIAYALEAWTGDSPYGRFMDRPSNVNLEAQVVYFETGKLGQDGPLTQVGLLLISDLIWKKIMRKPGPKVIVLDEAWALLKSPYGASVVEALYRRSRTFGAAVYAITQSLPDFLGGHARGIVENTYYHYFLPAPGQEEYIQKLFGIPERAIEKVYKRLEFRKGQYSDIMVVLRTGTGLVGGVIRNRASPLEYWAFTTDQGDKERRSQAVREFGSLEKALAHLAGGG